MGIKDINLNGTLLAVSEFFSFILIINFCHDQKRLTVFRYVIASQMIVCVFIFLLNCKGECGFRRTLITLLVCVIRTLNSTGFFIFLNYAVEVFETKNRMLGSSMTMSISFLFMPVWIIFKNILVDND